MQERYLLFGINFEITAVYIWPYLCWVLYIFFGELNKVFCTSHSVTYHVIKLGETSRQ